MSQEEFCLMVVSLLESAGVPYMVAGSQAGTIHGPPRMTQDLDLVIDPTEEQFDRFLSLLGEEWYADQSAAQQARRQRTQFNIIHLDSGWKADLIVRKDRPFSVEEFGRRQPGKMLDRMLTVVSPEDLILSKLEWNRITPSDRQLRDVVGVAKVRLATLDLAYLRRWAADLGVSEKLEEVLRQAAIQQPVPSPVRPGGGAS